MSDSPFLKMEEDTMNEHYNEIKELKGATRKRMEWEAEHERKYARSKREVDDACGKILWTLKESLLSEKGRVAIKNH